MRFLVVFLFLFMFVFFTDYSVHNVESIVVEKEDRFVDDLKGKSLEWYEQEFYLVKKISESTFELTNEENTLILNKKHLIEVLDEVKVGSEIVVFKHPTTNTFVSSLLVVE